MTGGAVQVLIRPFDAGEQRLLLELWKRCGLTGPGSRPDADIHGCTGNPWSELLVAECSRSPVGSVMVGHDHKRGWVHYLAVEPDCRFLGIGRRLMRAAEGWMRDRRVLRVEATIRPGNLVVRGFYDRIGDRPAEFDVFEKFLTRE
ncbi:MAG: GNAT family N-acetyltransferase [Pseudomonadota bacterium]|nr:GNAT family N-acetyltransferase [Pseudomonadota bacterium]